MSQDEPLSYRDAGLDLDKYAETMKGIAPLVRRTQDRTRVLDHFGGFASLFDLDPGRWLFSRKYRRPVLATCTDGVGSKLKVASLVNKFDTVGIDLVAMSVNDCLCTGAEPVVFLDYIAMPADDKEWTEALVKGVADGCLEADCSLVGGETAILPDIYRPGDFDMAGFCVGVVERDHVIDGSHVRPGDQVIGLESNGLHSNGYSLVRKLVFEKANLDVGDEVPELGRTVGEELLRPTRIYVKPVLSVLRHYPVKKRVIRGMAHITGGGLVENIPRVLPKGCRVMLRRGSWPVAPVFGWLQGIGRVEQAEMDRVFNQGIGFVLIVAAYFAESIQRQFEQLGVPAHRIGEIIPGEPGVEWA